MSIEPGVVFPQTEIGTDPAVVREYATVAEEAGYGHLLAYDHVLGGDPETAEGYDLSDGFHEPFALFSHLAAVTDAIRLVTGVLVLPQRQTALVAKQAATLDVLSEGRLRLGVGVGWNDLEYEALGQPFHRRGRRIEEQIEVLRALWSGDLVDYEGEFHRIPEAGINPPPVGESIPVWMGGSADRVLRRTARTADGWLPLYDPGPDLEEALATLDGYAREAGRDPGDLAVVAHLDLDGDDPEAWARRAAEWTEYDRVTHLAVNTMSLDLEEPHDHVDAIDAFAAAARAAGVDLAWE